MNNGTLKRLLSITLLLPGMCLAESYVGASLSLPVIKSEPEVLHGYQLMLNYDPQRFQWRKFNVYFDGGFSHFTTNSETYSSINIYSIAPVVRYSFRKKGPFLPFLEFSIGLSYLNRTHFENRNLGMHFAFQDRLGVGTSIGDSKQLTLGVHALHYSNANLAKSNAGITIPLVVDIGYRFK